MRTKVVAFSTLAGLGLRWARPGRGLEDSSATRVTQTHINLVLIKKTWCVTCTCRSGKCGAPEICRRTNVVYQATCKLCGSSYIGMTTRALHTRALEHIASARKHSLKSAFGEHYKNKHPKMVPSLNFRILQQCRDELRLHIEEALATQRHRPQLNRRDEVMGTGFLI